MTSILVSTCKSNPLTIEIENQNYQVTGLLPDQILLETDSLKHQEKDSVQFKLYSDLDKSPIEGKAQILPSENRIGLKLIDLNAQSKAHFQALYTNQLKLIKAADIMIHNPKTVSPNISMGEAVTLMNECKIGSVIVTNENKEALGILTERDLLVKFSEIKPEDNITQHMTDGVKTLSPDQSLQEIYSRFQNVSFRHFPVANKDNQIVGMISMRDLMKYWNIIIENDRDTMKRSYDRAMSVIVHDLRSPIYAIKSINELLVHELTTVEEYMSDKYPPIIDETCESMAKLIDDLLDLTTQSHGDIKLKILPTDMNSLAHKVVEMFKPRAQAKSIGLLFSGNEGLPKFDVDPQRFVEIFQNLISNGIKYSPMHSTVTLSLEETQNGLGIRVTDTGQGIPEAELPRVFDELAKISSRPTANEASTGLGLFITKKMIEAHGGTIRVESELGKGTTFIIELPYSQQQQTAA